MESCPPLPILKTSAGVGNFMPVIGASSVFSWKNRVRAAAGVHQAVTNSLRAKTLSGRTSRMVFRPSPFTSSRTNSVVTNVAGPRWGLASAARKSTRGRHHLSRPNGYRDRKAVLAIRQDLDDDSKAAITAVHGLGMIHLAH